MASDRTFGVDMVITEKGLDVIDAAGKKVAELGGKMTEASKAATDLGTSFMTKTGPGYREIQKAGSDAKIAQEGFAESIGLTDSKLRGALSTGLAQATGLLRDYVRENKDASDAVRQLVDVTDGASRAVQGFAAGGLAGALAATAGFTTGKLRELHGAAMDLREENKLGTAAAKLLGETLGTLEKKHRELGAAVGMSGVEVAKLAESDRAAYQALVKHANGAPELKIAENMKAAAAASVEMVRVQAAMVDAQRAIESANASKSASTAEKSASGAGINTINPLADIMKHQKLATDEATAAMKEHAIGVNAARKAMHDAGDASEGMGAKVVKHAQASLDAVTAMHVGLQALTQSMQIGGRGTERMDQAKLDEILGGLKGGKSPEMDAAIAMAQRGDLGGVRDIRDSARANTGAIGMLFQHGAASGGQVNQATMLEQALNRLVAKLEGAVMPSPDRSRSGPSVPSGGNSEVVAAIRTMSAKLEGGLQIDGRKLATEVANQLARGGFGSR